MEYNNTKDKEVIIVIESGETSNETITGNHSFPNSKSRKKKSLSKLVSGVLGRTSATVNESMELLIDRTNGGKQSCELVPLVGKDNEKERLKTEKAKKAPKPPRPPRGPHLDASDMRMVREIAKIATKKRERMERIRALKKIKADKASTLSSSSPSSSSSKSSGGTISAMVITILFFLVIIYQGFGSISSSSIALAEAPHAAPETKGGGLISVELHDTALSNDGAAPNSASPNRYTEHFSGLEFSSMG